MTEHARRLLFGGIASGVLFAVAACGEGGAASVRQAADNGPRVTLDGGGVRGVDDGEVLRFRGIPYGLPPVGELRWQPPQPVRKWTEVKDATKSGPLCAQPDIVDPTKLVGAEDCLTVDVTVPKKVTAPRKPVMVWLHGGGFTAGAGHDYDPRRLAAEGDVIVVTVEFRLGAFGYLSLPGMTNGGTFGLQDQQAALRWVRRNAQAFGGDPDNVTLFGESGGGIAVCGQLTSPGGKGLFAKVIMQSGSCGTALLPNAAGPGSPAVPFWRSLKEGHAASRTGAAQVGCPDEAKALACLRARSAAELLGLTGYTAAATYGGRTLPVAPPKALQSGAFHRVPVMSGHTRDEALAFASLFTFLGQPITDQNLRAFFVQGFGDKADEVARRYRRADYPSAAQAWAASYTDAIFACPHVRADHALARRTEVYAYEFADASAPPLFPSLPGFPAGASHGAELPYLFEVKDKPISYDGKPIPLTEAQRAVAGDMVAAWAAFAHSGRPSAWEKSWPRWRRGEGKAHLFTEKAGGTAVSTPAIDHACGFWDKIDLDGKITL